MTRVTHASVARALVAAALVSAAGCDSGPSAPQITDFTVAGIRVIHKPIAANDVVSARLYITGGSAALTPATAGIEHLYMDAMTRGTEKYDKSAFSALATSTGTSVGGTADKDYSVATMQAVRQNLDAAWDLFAQAIMHPAFVATEVDLARTEIVFDLKQRTDDPDGHLDLLSDSVFYAGHPYALEAEGTPATVAKFTRDDLIAWQKARLTKANLLLIVVGNVTRADVEKHVAATFGMLPAGDAPAGAVPALPAATSGVTVVGQALPTNYVLGTFIAPPRDDPDFPAFAVATRILNERLFEEVRTKRNLTYAVSAGLGAGHVGQGILYVTAVEPDTTLKVMLSEVRRMQNEPVPMAFANEVLNTFATNYWMGQQSNMGQAAQLGHWELTGGGWKNALTYTDRLKAVTQADIQRVATKYMKNAHFVVIGDPKKIDKKLFSSL